MDLASLTWVATYMDGTQLHQGKYGDIDRSKLLYFDILNPESKTPIIRLHLEDPRKRLIWRLRTMQSPGGDLRRVMLVGWQMTVHGENIQSIIYLTDSGGVLMSGEWDRLPEPFGAPVLHDFEK